MYRAAFALLWLLPACTPQRPSRAAPTPTVVSSSPAVEQVPPNPSAPAHFGPCGPPPQMAMAPCDMRGCWSLECKGGSWQVVFNRLAG